MSWMAKKSASLMYTILTLQHLQVSRWKIRERERESVWISCIVLLNIGLFSWRQATPTGGSKPAARYGHSGVVYKKRLYVLAGQDSLTDYNDVWAIPMTGRLYKVV